MDETFKSVGSWFSNLVGPSKPTLEEQLQQRRDLNFKQQQGIENQIIVIQQQLRGLKQNFNETPTSMQEECERLFMRIRALENEEQTLNNKLVLLQQASRNMNTTKDTFDTVKTVHESNQMVDTLIKENRKVLGANPETIMNRMRATNEKTDSLSSVISESAASINQASLDRYTSQKQDLDSEMSRYRSSLAQESSLAKRTQVLNTMPELPATVTTITSTSTVKPTSALQQDDPWLLFTQNGTQ